MYRLFLFIGILTVIAGCSSPGGVMLANGNITPCPDWHTDNQACGNAIWNSKVITQVKLGQTEDEVRAFMKHAPERREASLSPEGKTVETWSYVTDYQAELVTTLTFTNGRLTAIGQAAWKPSS